MRSCAILAPPSDVSTRLNSADWRLPGPANRDEAKAFGSELLAGRSETTNARGGGLWASNATSSGNSLGRDSCRVGTKLAETHQNDCNAGNSKYGQQRMTPRAAYRFAGDLTKDFGPYLIACTRGHLRTAGCHGRPDQSKFRDPVRAAWTSRDVTVDLCDTPIRCFSARVQRQFGFRWAGHGFFRSSPRMLRRSFARPELI